MAQIDSRTEFITVPELAAYLRCTPDGVYNLIRREKLGEAQGIFRPFHKQRPIRVNLQTFLNWRGDHAPPFDNVVPKGVVAELLGMLMPISTQVSQLAETITHAIQRLQNLYEHSGEDEEEHDCSNHTPHR